MPERPKSCSACRVFPQTANARSCGITPRGYTRLKPLEQGLRIVLGFAAIGSSAKAFARRYEMALWPWILLPPIIIWLKDRCEICGSKWTSNENCDLLNCGKNVCGECGQDVTWESYKDWSVSNDGRYRLGFHFGRGRSCLSHRENPNKIFLAIDNSERVKVFSINYEGRTPPITKNRSTITSQSYRDRKDAKRELKLLAALEGCDVVVNAELVRKETSDSDNPNYIYSVWKYKGLI